MSKSKIGWTENSWNPLTWNCTPVSPGCKHCYARAMSERFAANSSGGNFLNAPVVRERAFDEVHRLSAGPCFVCSMSDLFHKDVPGDTIRRVFDVFETRPDITWLVLTKRIYRASLMRRDLPFGPNVWIGTSIESAEYLWRVDDLRGITPASGRFVSFEPLLAPVYPDLTGIDWAIVGGESGKNRRDFNPVWASWIRLEAQRVNAAFYYKQGSAFKSGQDRLLHGRTWNGVPAAFNWTPEHTPEAQPVLL